MLRHFISPPSTRIPLDGTYKNTPEPKPAKPCAVSTCTQPAKPGCGGHCPRCWAERRARATTLY